MNTIPLLLTRRKQLRGLRAQLLLAFGFLSLLVLGVAGTALWGLRTVQQASIQAIEIDGPLRTFASKIALQTLLCRRYEKDVFLNIDHPSERSVFVNQWNTAYGELSQTIALFSAVATSSEDRQQASDWQAKSTTYQVAFGQLQAAINAGTLRTPQAADQALEPTKNAIRELTETAIQMRDRKVAAAQRTEATLAMTLRTVSLIVNSSAALALLIAIGFALVFSGRLIRPIGALHKGIDRLTSGDLDARLRLVRQDELGMVAQGFNHMADQLQAQLVELQQINAETDRLRAVEAERRQVLEQTVGSYLAFVQLVSQGNLTERLNVDQHGALGLLGEGLNEMVQRLHIMTSQVQQATNNLIAAAAEILAATTQQAAAAAEQSAAITQTSTTIEEVKAIAQQTAQQASQVAEESQAMLQVAQQGTQAVSETVSGMLHIQHRVESIAQTILALAEQTQAIGAIITTVSELAEQSNLLALNAAIEAARAGEQGKSFAVVALHVRDLAERSKAATGQVRTILGDIQRATNQAVLVTEEGSKGVNVGAQLSTQAGQVIQRIAGEVEGGAQANMQIAAAAQQQTAGMNQIGQAMLSIQQATTQTLASTRQAEQAAHDLHRLAQSLQHAIAAYQI